MGRTKHITCNAKRLATLAKGKWWTLEERVWQEAAAQEKATEARQGGECIQQAL